MRVYCWYVDATEREENCEFLGKEKEAPCFTAHREYYHLHNGTSTKDCSQWVKEENIKTTLWGEKKEFMRISQLFQR